jgi:hypothetical protein
MTSKLTPSPADTFDALAVIMVIDKGTMFYYGKSARSAELFIRFAKVILRLLCFAPELVFIVYLLTLR